MVGEALYRQDGDIDPLRYFTYPFRCVGIYLMASLLAYFGYPDEVSLKATVRKIFYQAKCKFQWITGFLYDWKVNSDQ